ncbi:recombinase RecT [Streptomyces boncukensis]|uniref:Recombinase RecT n=1 Tax=Streptomyces boncukensis TaxID=2711219 RepID=A0A6G4WV46_9ACTN|nr:recombinase RecT [Streptomyces boncukensis]NGO69159.1 recombinase RecT [Streptomyces boncukensis]
MSSEIVKAQPATPAQRPGGALSLASMTPHDAWKFAEALAGSGMLPRQYQNNPASVLWALEYGRAIGLDVITTTQSVHVIQGRATASADLMASLTRRAGHRMRIVSDDEHAEVTIYRADDPEFPFTAKWDTEKAQRAKLTGKDTWKQFPGAMLRARAISECVRMACPEVLHGSIYTPEEIGANVDQDGVPLDAEVQQLRTVQPGEPDQGQRPAPQRVEPGRDFVAEARAASDPAQVRQIWKDAREAGLGEKRLGWIEGIGRSLTAGPPPPKPDDAGEVVSEEEQAARDAEKELRAFADEHDLPDIAADFESATGMPLDQAIAPQIRGFLDQLRGTAA